jgi:hypothetical protein
MAPGKMDEATDAVERALRKTLVDGRIVGATKALLAEHVSKNQGGVSLDSKCHADPRASRKPGTLAKSQSHF